jgi:TonB family protein
VEDNGSSSPRPRWMMPAIAALGCGAILLIVGVAGGFMYFRSRPAASPTPPPTQTQSPPLGEPAGIASEPSTLAGQPGVPAAETASEEEGQGPVSTGRGPLRINVATREPRKVYNVQRIYPSEARHARVQGIVVLDVTVGTRGRVEDVQVVRSIPMLDDAAIEAVEQWVYEPTYVDGTPTPVVLTVPVSFWLPTREEVIIEEDRAPADRVIIEERHSRRRRGRVIEGEVRRRNY